MTQTTQTMPSLKDVGTKLGQTTTKKSSMRYVIEYVNQNRGKSISKKEILNKLNWQDTNKQHIENCYHNGYILKGQHLGDDCYFVPNLSDQDLISLRNQFEKLGTLSQDKVQLIQQLVQQLTSSSPNANHTSQNQPNQTPASNQSGTAKTYFQEEIELLKKDIKALQEVVLTLESSLKKLEASYNEPQVMDLMRQEIKEKEIKLDAKKEILATYQQMLPQIP